MLLQNLYTTCIWCKKFLPIIIIIIMMKVKISVQKWQPSPTTSGINKKKKNLIQTRLKNIRKSIPKFQKKKALIRDNQQSSTCKSFEIVNNPQWTARRKITIDETLCWEILLDNQLLRPRTLRRLHKPSSWRQNSRSDSPKCRVFGHFNVAPRQSEGG